MVVELFFFTRQLVRLNIHKLRIMPYAADRHKEKFSFAMVKKNCLIEMSKLKWVSRFSF